MTDLQGLRGERDLLQKAQRLTKGREETGGIEKKC